MEYEAGNEEEAEKLWIESIRRPDGWQETKTDMLQLAKNKAKKILKENDPHPLGEQREREIDRILKKCIETCK